MGIWFSEREYKALRGFPRTLVSSVLLGGERCLENLYTQIYLLLEEDLVMSVEARVTQIYLFPHPMLSTNTVLTCCGIDDSQNAPREMLD